MPNKKALKPRIGMIVRLIGSAGERGKPKRIIEVRDTGFDAIVFCGLADACKSYCDHSFFTDAHYEVVWEPPSERVRRQFRDAARELRDTIERRKARPGVTPDTALPGVDFVWCYPLLHDDISVFSSRNTSATYRIAAEIAESLALDGT